MSIQSKARRDARKRKSERERNRVRADAPPIEPHAELRDSDGNLLAGVVRQSGVWVLGMDGRIVGSFALKPMSSVQSRMISFGFFPESFAALKITSRNHGSC